VSREISSKTQKNPAGFAGRLQTLMDGWGYKLRDVAERTGLTHATIDNWLKDKNQAGADQVSEVAKLFGWTFDELYSGRAPDGIMDRVARLEAFRKKAWRIGDELFTEANNPDSITPTIRDEPAESEERIDRPAAPAKRRVSGAHRRQA
jgi:transcriptional regulator with XRE-family HTH domain